MDNVTLTDALPTGMTFISGQVTSVGTGIVTQSQMVTGSGQSITADFGTVLNPSDGTIGTDDEVRIEVIAVVTDSSATVAGAQLTNSAALTITPEGEAALDTQTAQATVEVVEPELTVDKIVSDEEPLVGDTITYTVTLTNEASASGPAYNVNLVDNLPFQLSLAAPIGISDHSLATVASGTSAGFTTITISADRLLPGESVTITYDVFVGYQTDVLSGVINLASVSSTSTPLPNNPFNQTHLTEDDAIIIAQPIPRGEEERKDPFANLGIDDADFLPILAIDPIYSGTAEPGSNVTIRLYGEQGQLTGVRQILADSGGHWIAIFPRTSLETPYDTFFSTLGNSRVLDADQDLVDDQPVRESRTLGSVRVVDVGTDLGTESYYISLTADRPSTLPQENGMFNARTFYASALNQEAFAVGNTLKVDEVFENVAAFTVQNLYKSSTDPLGSSLNRFNYEFLGGSTAVAGSAH